MSDAPAAQLTEAFTDPAILGFLRKALEAQEKLDKPEAGLWYRDHSDKVWDLLPGLFRPGTARQTGRPCLSGMGAPRRIDREAGAEGMAPPVQYAALRRSHAAAGLD
jgi:hypothetical protein